MTPQWFLAVLAVSFVALIVSRPAVWGFSGGLIYAAGLIGRGMANETWGAPGVKVRTWLEAVTAIIFGAVAAEAFGPWASAALHGPQGSGQAIWFVLGLSTPRMYPVVEKLIGARLKSIVEAILGRSP